jgi:hypothetical protein
VTVRALCASQGSQGEHQVVNPVQAALQRQRAQRGAVLPFWQVSHCVMGRVPHPAHCSIQLHNQLQVLTLQAGCDALQLVPVGTLLAHAACSCCFCWSYLLVSCACSRDMWFEVPLPFFLRDNVYGLGWERVAVGAMLAVSTCKLQLGHVSARGGISAPPTRGGGEGGTARDTDCSLVAWWSPHPAHALLCCGPGCVTNPSLLHEGRLSVGQTAPAPSVYAASLWLQRLCGASSALLVVLLCRASSFCTARYKAGPLS